MRSSNIEWGYSFKDSHWEGWGQRGNQEAQHTYMVQFDDILVKKSRSDMYIRKVLKPNACKKVKTWQNIKGVANESNPINSHTKYI